MSHVLSTPSVEEGGTDYSDDGARTPTGVPLRSLAPSSLGPLKHLKYLKPPHRGTLLFHSREKKVKKTARSINAPQALDL